MAMTAVAVVPTGSAVEAVRAKGEEIDRATEALRLLRTRREREAVAGGDTRVLRREIADAEADLEEMRMQSAHLVQVLEEEEYGALHRERHAALAGVYWGDVEYLKARRFYLVKRGELEEAQAAITAILGGRPYYMVRAEGSYLQRLGVECDPKAPVPVLPLKGGVSGQGGETVEEVDAEIVRVLQLAADAEVEAEATP